MAFIALALVLSALTTITALKTSKADLVDGKIPVTQLPPTLATLEELNIHTETITIDGTTYNILCVD